MFLCAFALNELVKKNQTTELAKGIFTDQSIISSARALSLDSWRVLLFFARGATRAEG
jgi:hypothetical protein